MSEYEPQRLTIEGCDPYDGKWVRASDTPTVPRVASSLDELRVGQVVTCHDKNGRLWQGQRGWSKPVLIPSDWDRAEWAKSLQTHYDAVVILSDPPPEPVTVSRETFDRLAEALGDGPDFTPARVAARALVEEVRGADQ